MHERPPEQLSEQRVAPETKKEIIEIALNELNGLETNAVVQKLTQS